MECPNCRSGSLCVLCLDCGNKHQPLPESQLPQLLHRLVHEHRGAVVLRFDQDCPCAPPENDPDCRSTPAVIVEVVRPLEGQDLALDLDVQAATFSPQLQPDQLESALVHFLGPLAAAPPAAAEQGPHRADPECETPQQGQAGGQ